MKDILKELDRVLRGKDQPNTKKKNYENDEDEEINDEHDEDDDTEDNEDDEFSFMTDSDQEKRDPSYKQDVALVRMMLTNKLKERLTELRGKKKNG